MKTCENNFFLENMIASTIKNRFPHSNHVLDKWIRLKLNLILKERHYFLIMMYGTSEIWCMGHRETKFNNFLIIQPIIKKIGMHGYNDCIKIIFKKKCANDCANMIDNQSWLIWILFLADQYESQYVSILWLYKACVYFSFAQMIVQTWLTSITIDINHVFKW